MGVGLLPFAGGLAEQPPALMTCIDFCSSIEQKHEEHMKKLGLRN